MIEKIGSFERPNWDVYFMIQAVLAKLRSNCLSRQIGAVIVKDNRQISTGYNGTPTGLINCFEGGCKRCYDRLKGSIKSSECLERCLCVHAEANAILQCVIYGNAGNTINGTLYSTVSPCLECSKMAITVGIKRIVVLDRYTEDLSKYTINGVDILEQANVQFMKMNPIEIDHWFTKLGKSDV
ncbi:MAG: deoxycytidylate deaminase [Candidatus Nitrosocosmicus sp.]